ncbi:MAG: hypothetical protein RR206_03030 [Bacteroidaceae bacterium]
MMMLLNSNNVSKVSVVAFGSEIISLLYELRWLIAFSFCLILVDLWFGCKESVINNVHIRKSRAGRRTMNKFIDYMCYLLIGGLFGKAIGEPLGVDMLVCASIMLGISCLFEMDSIAGHICEIHHIGKFSFRRLFISILMRKNKDLVDSFNDNNKNK